MFRIEFFSDPHKFLAVMGPIYENDESCAILPLGVALRIAEDIAAYGKHQPLLAVVRDDQDYVAASAVMTPPQRLLVYSDMPDEEALAILAEEIWEQGWQLHGVTALPQPVKPLPSFGRPWCAPGQCPKPGRFHTNCVRCSARNFPPVRCGWQN